eukprot:2610329-Prymnesium_polylepis.1
MQSHAVLLYGSYSGLHVDKPRFFEANFPIIVDAYWSSQDGACARWRASERGGGGIASIHSADPSSRTAAMETSSPFKERHLRFHTGRDCEGNGGG